MPEPFKLTFEKLFKFTNTALWINGSHPTLPRGWVLRSSVTLTISLYCFYMLCNSIINYRLANKEYEDVVRETIMTIISFTLICKYAIIVCNRNIVLNLIRHINEDFEKSLNFPKDEVEIISKYADKGSFIVKFWLISAVSCGLVFALKGILSTIYYHCIGEPRYILIFEMILPDIFEKHKDEFFGYVRITLLLVLFDLYAVCVYVGFEPLISIFLLHCCGQLDILSLRMKHILQETSNSAEILAKIKDINVNLQSIYKFVNDVQFTFVALFEFTMKTTTFLLPFTVFEIVQSLQEHEINVEFLSILSCELFQFYLPCYYSTLLMEKSENLRQAIYSCDWERHQNPKVRKMLIFMMTRTNKPVVLYTIFYPLTRDTFAEMCRHSYAIYNIMNAVWAKSNIRDNSHKHVAS